MASTSLIAALAEASGRRLAEDAEVAAALERMVGDARGAWPALALDDAAFMRHLSRHLPDGHEGLALALRGWHGSDLYLAAACTAGHRAAAAIFEREYLSRVPGVIGRVVHAAADIDEIVQSVRVAVLTGDRPRIAQYSGRGPLHGWVRTVALNAALMAQRGRRERVAASASMPERAIEGRLDPEMQLVRERHRPQFQSALDEALRGLSVRERTLLRAYFVDDLTIDELGGLFRVHRATAARWLQAAHSKLLDETRARVMQAVPLTASEFDGLAALLKSELTLTFSSLKP